MSNIAAMHWSANKGTTSSSSSLKTTGNFSDNRNLACFPASGKPEQEAAAELCVVASYPHGSEEGDSTQQFVLLIDRFW